jgi:5-formyltetrahydrofolate cyclo-ligase
MQNDPIMEKARLRSLVREQIRLLDDPYIVHSDKRIFEAVCRLPEYRSANRIFIYCSTEREIDTAAVGASARDEGKLVAYPEYTATERWILRPWTACLRDFSAFPSRLPKRRRLFPEKGI